MNGQPAAGDNALTAPEIALMEQVARQMVNAGEWRRVARSRSPNGDMFDVYVDEASDAALSVGRCLGGRFAVIDHRHDRIRFGRTLSEALAYVASRLRLAGGERVPLRS